MKTIFTLIAILLGIMTFAQSNSSLELAYDFVPSKLVHYNLSKPGSFDTKYRQPYSYIGTLKYNQGFKKNTIGLGVRGFWINGNEKSIGAQLDYYRDLQFEQPVKLSFGLSTIWDGYRFEDNQLRSQIKIDIHTIK
ncbi:MAG: hypothetical protein KJP21_09460, partial [Bacteroidia bacterium]|nr:hypothetical protein [Bacteroidia bacterium]NNJ55558.1 hypothetical protein [Bacteroidia bacterium]